MSTSIACSAIDLSKRMALNYGGTARVVEVHTVGINLKGNSAMMVYQVRGASSSGETEGWKMMLFSKCAAVTIIDEGAEVPRPGYKPNDAGFIKIQRQV
jgi:hypothetical protein